MGSKYVRDKNGEIVGMIDDPIGDAKEWEKSSANSGGYDAAAHDQYEREHHPIQYWGMKVWKYVCIISEIVIVVVLLKKQMYSEALFSLLIAVIMYFMPLLVVHVFPVALALPFMLLAVMWGVITRPFVAIIELIKAIKKSKK